MHANSRIPTSAQTGIHEHLAALLDRHTGAVFRKPFTDYNRAAFEISLERRLRIAPDAPLIAMVGRLADRQPTYVLDIPGGHGKTPLVSGTTQSIGEGCWSVSDYRGERHIWP